MQAAGVAVHQTLVGDRHILSALEANHWVLGGEQSGHLIFRHLAPTGDGMLTGCRSSTSWPARAGRWPTWPGP